MNQPLGSQHLNRNTLSENLIRGWLDKVHLVPSGGNARPWQVNLRSNVPLNLSLSIRNSYLPLRSPMDLDLSSSVVALGCFAKTLQCLAAIDGFDLLLEFEDSSGDFSKGQAHIHFSQRNRTNLEYTAETLENRHTWREPLSTAKLADSQKLRMTTIAASYPKIKLKDFTDLRKELLPHLVALEKVRWSNRTFLDGLFEEINFAPIKSSQDLGIWISDLGLNLPDRLLFYSLHRFPKLRELFKPALVAIAPKKSIAHLIEKSGGLYFLEADQNQFESLFQLGFCYQNLWLDAAKANLGFQPVSPTLLAYNFWQTRDERIFNSEDIAAIKRETQYLSERFQLDTRKYLIGFRIGQKNKSV